MIKKIFLILAVLTLITPAMMNAQQDSQDSQDSKKKQDSQNTQSSPNVELPEFVITGVERVSMPAVSKPKADIVPTLSNDFFKPSYSPEELPIAELSNPVRKDITFVNEASKYNGRLQVGAGYYTVPMGDFTYGHSFDNGLLSAKLWGSNVRSYYKDYSGYNNAGIDLKGDFFNSYNSGFLPGTKFTVGGSFVHDSYKFFMSPDPIEQRDRNLGNIKVGFNNLLKNTLKYGLNLNESLLNVSDVALSENVFTAKGYFETGFNGMLIGINSGYKNQNLNLRTPGSESWGFIENSGYVKFKPSDNLHFAFGLYYAASKGDRSFFPTGSVTLKLSDNLTLLGEMAPYSELLTVTDLVYQNRYLNLISNSKQALEIPLPLGMGTAAVEPGHVTNVFVDNKVNLKGALKYEYNKYFEIDGGFRFVDYNNYPYFVPSDSAKGKFNLNTSSALRFEGFMNFLFHPGPYGLFYGDVQIEHFYNSQNATIPGVSGFRTNLSYEYNFENGLSTQTRFTFASSTWADVPNRTKIDPYFNLGIRLGYEISPGLSIFGDFSNLLNQNNYIWYNYKEKPFDAVVGIDYKF